MLFITILNCNEKTNTNYYQKKTVFDGTSINYEITRTSGDIFLVFLHGLGGDLTAWDNERLIFHELGYNTLAIDLRGHGLSDHPNNENDYALQKFANDVLSIIQEEKITHCALIGHCFGGMIAIVLEGNYPKTAQALILIDTNFKSQVLINFPTARALVTKVINIATRILPHKYIKVYHSDPKLRYAVDWYWPGIFKNMLYMSLKDWLLIFEDIMNLNLNHLIEKIHIPTLVITGSEDSIFPPFIAIEIHKLIKSSELDYIEGGNHVVVINDPVEVSIDINRFLKHIHFHKYLSNSLRKTYGF